MFEHLKLKGKLKGSYDKKEFSIDFNDKTIRVDLEDKMLLKTAKDLFFEDLKKQGENAGISGALKELDIEVYLERELIARIGKNAKPNFVSSFLGIKNLEVVSNSRMSELMELL